MCGGGGGGRAGSGRSPDLFMISCNSRCLQIKMDRINNCEKVETPFFFLHFNSMEAIAMETSSEPISGSQHITQLFPTQMMLQGKFDCDWLAGIRTIMFESVNGRTPAKLTFEPSAQVS